MSTQSGDHRMQDIICPNCKKAFKVDERGYADILKQVRDTEFDQQLAERIEIATKEKESALALAASQSQTDLQKIESEKNREIDSLKQKLEQALIEKDTTAKLTEVQLKSELEKITSQKDQEVSLLKAEMATLKESQDLLVAKQTSAITQERDEYKNQLEKLSLEKTISESAIKDKYETQLRDRDDAIERLKDMKARLSTKMLGETLEQHCETEFNRIRSTAFPHAYFEKDNDAKTGSKGDYIFRDFDEEGNEIISIMFEMKNESDATATKKKNEDFFKELDKDRSEKNCEYGVLVSMLEPDSELYNTGIVDVFYRFPKMYVVRPQFFVPIITILL